MSDIGYIQEVDLWYMNVAEGKNSNSIRALPITQPLIELGFVKYVQKMRALGAKYLFPHRDWTTPTAISKPSKTTSERFAESLDRIGITSPRLVFHSFRHTVITMMHDAGVPLAIAMQIVGHEAQEHALEMGSITEEEARSVHLSTYVHMGEARPGIEHPLLPLKTALERAIKLPLAYEKLAICAQIVLEHMKKPGTEFVSGWKQQRQRYTDTLLSRLA